MLEEPLGRSPAYLGSSQRPLLEDAFFRDPFQSALRPAVDVSEEGNNYVVEAELPGVKKENVQVRIGDGGRSVTIEGRVVERRGGVINPPQTSEASTSEGAHDAQVSQASEGTFFPVYFPILKKMLTFFSCRFASCYSHW
jgi:hypothetical protein